MKKIRYIPRASIKYCGEICWVGFSTINKVLKDKENQIHRIKGQYREYAGYVGIYGNYFNSLNNKFKNEKD